MTDLAITARCWQDLENLAAKFSPEVAEHVIEVFWERRGADPDSGETMSGVGGPLRKLHTDLSGGRSIRALTWYDRGRDVCWLLAAGEHDVYRRVEQLAKPNSHLPTPADFANFAADAPIRLIERVVRNAKAALQQAIEQPGREVPITYNPPPKAYFRVVADQLWVRIVMYESKQPQLTQRQLAALQVAVFGAEPVSRAHPEDGGQWDSIYLAGSVPSLDSWPPPMPAVPPELD